MCRARHRDPIQHDDVESTQTVCGDMQEGVLVHLVDIAYLPLVDLLQTLQVRVQNLLNFGLRAAAFLRFRRLVAPSARETGSDAERSESKEAGGRCGSLSSGGT